MMARIELEEENSRLKKDIGHMHLWAQEAISSLQKMVVTLHTGDIVPEAITDHLHRVGCYRVRDVQKWTQTQLFDAGFDLDEVTIIERGLERYNLCLNVDLYDPEKRQIRLENLISNRTFRCLMKQRIDTLGKLQQCTEEDLMSIRNFGRESLCEVTAKLAEYGMKLKDRVVSDISINDLNDDDWINLPD